FVPGHIGAQDGAVALMCGLLIGSTEVGLAVALIRRARELSWSFLGLMIGGWFSLRRPEPASVSADGAHGFERRHDAFKLVVGHAGEHGQADMTAARHQGGVKAASVKIAKDRV